MTNKTFNDLTATTSAASTDAVALWVVSGGVLRKITVADLIKGFVSGGGLVATGGFTLTVPATMTAAGRNVANTFTQPQVVSPSGDVAAITANMATGNSGWAYVAQYNSANRIYIHARSNLSRIDLVGFDNSTGNGPQMHVRNNNGASPAPGAIALYYYNGVARYYWTDDSGNLRASDVDVTNATKNSGTVVGTQTSWHEFKADIVENTKYKQALKRIVNTPIYDFRYTNTSMMDDEDGSPIFTGFVGYRKRDWFLMNTGRGQVPALDTITVVGTLSMAVKQLNSEIEKKDREIANLNDRVTKLETDYAALLARVEELEAA